MWKIDTLYNNEQKYLEGGIIMAHKVYTFQEISETSMCPLLDIMDSNILSNFPISFDETKITEDFYRKSLARLKVKFLWLEL